MIALLAKAIIGLLVGILVGLTGLGAGVVLLPILMFGLGVSPIIAVGSDALFNCFTKLGSGYLHWRKGSVNWSIAGALLAGSIPGSLLGVGLLVLVRNAYGDSVNHLLRIATGLLLVIVPVLLLLKGQFRAGEDTGRPLERKFKVKVALVGLLSGILVGMTSIGSGSITMMLLLLIYPYAPVIVVGTDIVHAVALTGFTSTLHFRMGNVDPLLVGSLLLGSVPGSVIGTRLSNCVPGYWLKRVLCGVLFLTGARMLFV